MSSLDNDGRRGMVALQLDPGIGQFQDKLVEAKVVSKAEFCN